MHLLNYLFPVVPMGLGVGSCCWVAGVSDIQPFCLDSLSWEANVMGVV